ncbi:MAG: tetratricopeptide repeat protein [Longimicrobiales bacterium]
MTIRLTTLGGLRVVGDHGELEAVFGRRLRAALFVYLAVERRAARASLAALFWANCPEEQARRRLRQGLYDLRKVLGDGWIDATPHEVRVSTDVHADVHAFTAALERGDPEAAARLYGGPYLEGMYLVDQTTWESWVDGRRAEYARCFRRACREWLEARRAAGDLRGAVQAAQRWVAPDPFDDEAQHRLIEVLAEAGERAEAIRQYETYARLLEPEGLRPLDQTATLIERVRSEPATWPDQRDERQTSPPAVTLDVSPSKVGRPGPTALIDTGSPPANRRSNRRRASLVPAGIGALVVLLGLFWLVWARDSGQLQGTPVRDGAPAEGERIVLADFATPRTDPALGAVVTDALRIDLLEAEAVQLIDPAEVREVLARMRVENDSALTVERAREVAVRSGAKAVLEGEIAKAGSGYLLTAALRSARSGHILVAFRESAERPDEVIPAIDRLSRRIRRRAGESVRSIDAAPPLARVTSASLDALRVYGEATRAFERAEYARVIVLLEEALEIDPEFAMAWRLLALTLGGAGWDRDREVEAATRAYELRDRLSPRERNLAEARYHRGVTRDHGATVAAYRRALELDPHDPTALNNLGVIYHTLGDLEAAADLFHRAVGRPNASATAYLNLVRILLGQGRLDAAREWADTLSARFPDNLSTAEARFWVLFRLGDDDGARDQVERTLSDPMRSARERAWAHDRMARLALRRGRLGEARGHMQVAEQIVQDAGPPYNPLAWRLGRAHAEVTVGDPERGVRLLREGVESDRFDETSPSERLHTMQGTILGMAGRPADVEAVLLRFESDVAAALHAEYRARTEAVRAFIGLHRGDPGAAVQAVERARAIQPCRFCFAEQMGWALREAGRLREAAQEWEVVLDGKDSSVDIGFQLAQQLWTLQRIAPLYEQLGDTTRALHHYRRLVRLWQDADPELRPRVEHARRRIAALRRE